MSRAAAPDWDAPVRRPTGTDKLAVGLVAGAIWGVPAVLGILLVGPLALRLVFVLGPVAWLAWTGWTAPSWAVRKSGSRPAAEGEIPRVRNLAAGLAERVGVLQPEVRVLPGDGAVAIVTGGKRPVVAVTEALASGFTRTETEAVIAHCVVRLASPGLRLAAVRARLSVLDSMLSAQVGFDDDVKAAALIRYPVALAAAIGKATAPPGRLGPVAFVAEGPSHRPAAERIAAVGDL
jgi:hypothetical protein